MSLFNTLNTGASGMGASSTNLSVIGDNIANIGTVGFKSGSASFADAFPNLVNSLGGPAQLGNGSGLGDIGLDFSQGSLVGSTNALDVAILGQGFFEVRSGNETFYTRDGGFRLNNENRIVTSSGLAVQGYQSINGVLTSTIGDLQVDPNGAPQQATTAVTLSATLSAEADATSMPFDDIRAATPFDGSAGAPTLDALSTAADFSTSVTVYDSLGIPHDVTLFFERDSGAPDNWIVTAVLDGGQVDTDGDGIADGTPGTAFEIGQGTVQFDTQGELVASSGIVPVGGWTFAGAEPFEPDFNFGLDPLGNPTEGLLRMNGTSSFLTTISQDGYPAGSLDSVRVEQDGTILGQYTNGEEQVLGRLAVATFAASNGLDRVGGNLYRATRASGEPSLGVAGVGGRGGTSGFALESSNVEMEEQFVRMIQAQRAYQANTGVIRTADEALQQLIQLV